MNSNFTDETLISLDDITGAVNFSSNNLSSTQDLQYFEPTTRQYESIPFASTETTFSTNPFLPRMTDALDLDFSNSRQNNIPDYNFTPVMDLTHNLSNNQNSGLEAGSSRLICDRLQQSQFVLNSQPTPSTAHCSTSSEIHPRLSSSNGQNFIFNNVNPDLTSVNVSSHLNNISAHRHNDFKFLSGGRITQQFLNSGSGGIIHSPASSQPSFPISSGEIRNPRSSLSTDIPNISGDLNASRKAIRYSRGQGLEDPNSSHSHGAGPSNMRSLRSTRDENEVIRNNNLPASTFSYSNCDHQYRLHPYLPIIGNNSHDRQLNLQRNSEILRQMAYGTPISDISRDIPPHENVNATAGTSGGMNLINTLPEMCNNEMLYNQQSRNGAVNQGLLLVENQLSNTQNIHDLLNANGLNASIANNETINLLYFILSTQNQSNLLEIARNQYNLLNIAGNHLFNNAPAGITFGQFVQLQAQGPQVYNQPRQRRRRADNGLAPGQRPMEFNPYSGYEGKLLIFKTLLKPPARVPKIFEIRVKRSNIFEDSFRVITQVNNVEKLKAKLWIIFDGEIGLDYGGIQREWFCILSREIFDPNYGFFQICSTDNYCLEINPNSGKFHKNHLSYFTFIGRIVGMSVYHGRLLDASFSPIFYSLMLNKKITLEDVKKVDAQYYKNLSWICQNDPSDLELDFTVNDDSLGEIVKVDLIPNGSNVSVTNENKDFYIEHFINWKFVRRIKQQLEFFLMGFFDIIPKEAIWIFTETELESLICGIQEIDVKDWRKNTVYSGGYYARHETIKFFWKLVKSFDNNMRSKLLQFVTGTSKVPMNGFRHLYGSNGPLLFSIQRIGTVDSLPRSHTCFNRLDLPPYETYEQLKDKLLYALEGCAGFGGVD